MNNFMQNSLVRFDNPWLTCKSFNFLWRSGIFLEKMANVLKIKTNSEYTLPNNSFPTLSFKKNNS